MFVFFFKFTTRIHIENANCLRLSSILISHDICNASPNERICPLSPNLQTSNLEPFFVFFLILFICHATGEVPFCHKSANLNYFDMYRITATKSVVLYQTVQRLYTPAITRQRLFLHGKREQLSEPNSSGESLYFFPNYFKFLSKLCL